MDPADKPRDDVPLKQLATRPNLASLAGFVGWLRQSRDPLQVIDIHEIQAVCYYFDGNWEAY